MNTIAPDQLLKRLALALRHQRFLTPPEKIPTDVWHALEQSLVLTPTSYGLQPYRFFVVQDVTKRAALLPNSWGQKQVVECSHFVVFAARTEMKEADVAQTPLRPHQPSPGHPDGFHQVLRRHDAGQRRGERPARGKTAHEWAARQVYIAIGNFMTCCAVLGVDACPMEGITPPEYDKILGLEGSGLQDRGGLRRGLSCGQRQVNTPRSPRCATGNGRLGEGG